MKAKMNKNLNYIYICVQIITIFFCIFMFFDDKKIESAILFLPVAFFVINSMFFANYVRKDVYLTKLLVFALYFVRLSVLPLLYFLSGEVRLYEGYASVTSGSMNNAFYLMVYEYFVVQAVFFLHERAKLHQIEKNTRRKTRSKFLMKKNISKKVLSRKKKYNFFPIVLLCMTGFVVAVYIFLPEVQASFKTLLMLDEVDFTSSGYSASINQVGTMRRIIATLFSVAFDIIRILLPAHFLVRAKEKGKAGIFILFASVIMQFAFITSTFAQSIVAALTIVLLFGYLYPQKKKFLILMIGITTIGVITLYFLVRYTVGSSMYAKNANLISYIAKTVSAYFTGIENVAGCFVVKKGHEFETVIADVIGTIPFNSTIFRGFQGDKFQTYFNGANHSYGQIPPAIGSGYYQFGWLFSPIYVVLMLKLSMYYYDRAQKDKNPLKYAVNIFCCIVFALGLVMYNESIAFSWYFGWGIFMFFALKFTNKDEFS